MDRDRVHRRSDIHSHHDGVGIQSALGGNDGLHQPADGVPDGGGAAAVAGGAGVTRLGAAAAGTVHAVLAAAAVGLAVARRAVGEAGGAHAGHAELPAGAAGLGAGAGAADRGAAELAVAHAARAAGRVAAAAELAGAGAQQIGAGGRAAHGPAPVGEQLAEVLREGVVVSNKMEKTAVVAVVERVRHPKYGKFMLRTKKLYAHDEANDVNIGDKVRVMETRPLSKNKRWRLVEVIEKAK